MNQNKNMSQMNQSEIITKMNQSKMMLQIEKTIVSTLSKRKEDEEEQFISTLRAEDPNLEINVMNLLLEEMEIIECEMEDVEMEDEEDVEIKCNPPFIPAFASYHEIIHVYEKNKGVNGQGHELDTLIYNHISSLSCLEYLIRYIKTTPNNELDMRICFQFVCRLGNDINKVRGMNGMNFFQLLFYNMRSTFKEPNEILHYYNTCGFKLDTYQSIKKTINSLQGLECFQYIKHCMNYMAENYRSLIQLRTMITNNTDEDNKYLRNLHSNIKNFYNTYENSCYEESKIIDFKKRMSVQLDEMSNFVFKLEMKLQEKNIDEFINLFQNLNTFMFNTDCWHKQKITDLFGNIITPLMFDSCYDNKNDSIMTILVNNFDFDVYNAFITIFNPVYPEVIKFLVCKKYNRHCKYLSHYIAEMNDDKDMLHIFNYNDMLYPNEFIHSCFKNDVNNSDTLKMSKRAIDELINSLCGTNVVLRLLAREKIPVPLVMKLCKIDKTALLFINTTNKSSHVTHDALFYLFHRSFELFNVSVYDAYKFYISQCTVMNGINNYVSHINETYKNNRNKSFMPQITQSLITFINNDKSIKNNYREAWERKITQTECHPFLCLLHLYHTTNYK